MNSCKIYLKPKKDESLLRFHPWIFSGAIASIVGEPSEGDPVDVYSSNNQFLGVGHYQIGSIMVRILSFTPVKIDIAFWTERISKALELRQALGLASIMQPEICPPGLILSVKNDTYRLIHGEGDFLPGLSLICTHIPLSCKRILPVCILRAKIFRKR